MELVIVGKNDDCRIDDVVLEILGTSPKLPYTALLEIMDKLGTNTILQEQVIECLQEKNATIYDLMEEILREWAHRTSTVASLDKLVYILKKSNLADSAEKLRQRYCAKIIEGPRNKFPIEEEQNRKSVDCGLIKIVCLEAKGSGEETQAKLPHHMVEFTDGCLCPKNQSINLALTKISLLLQVVSIFVSITLLVILFLPKHKF